MTCPYNRVSSPRSSCYLSDGNARGYRNMYHQTTRGIRVTVMPVYIDERSSPEQGKYFWAYRVVIFNNGDSTVQEFPVSVLRWMRLMLPVGGGGYFRIFPWWFTRWAFKKLEKEGVPIHFYIHPWEIDSEQPRIRQISTITQFRHYRNIDRTFHRLDRMLGEFSFGRVTPPISTSTLALE